MTKRSFLLGAAAGALAAALPAASAAQVLRYGGDADFPPFESLDADGRPRGFQIDLLAALGPLIGAEFEIRLRPWDQTEQAFRDGQVDVVAMVDTAERRAWALFSRGHATPALGLYRLHDRPELPSLGALAGLRIAVPDGAPMQETRRTWLANLQATLLPMPGPEQALAALAQGLADVALVPLAYGDRLLASGRWPGVVRSRHPLDLQTYALAVAPGRTALQTQLQQGLDQLEADGRLEQLRLRWLGSHSGQAERDRLARGLDAQRNRTWMAVAAGGSAALLLGAGLWWRGRHLAAERQARRAAEAALAEAGQLLTRSFAQHPDPMLLVEQDSGTVRDANAALLALVGLPAARLIGQPLAALSTLVDDGVLPALVQGFGAQGRLDAVPLRLRRADGALRDTLLSADPLPVGGRLQVFCLLRDITEQLAHDASLRAGYDALAAELQQARADLQSAQAGQAQAEGRLHEFTRAVSHDLKTPLNAVQGFAGLLQKRLEAGHVQEAMQHAQRIEFAARRMAAMIDGLTRLAQVGRVPLQRQPLDMLRLVDETWALLQPALAGRPVVFRVDPLPPAEGDPDLVAQVWQNLLGNAAKYSAERQPARVAVSSHRDARGLWYRVTDNGAGFDMAQAGRLFMPFQRLHEGSRFAGSGVGLSLVRRIVEHHGGEVRLRSAPGVGTVAEFTLDPAPASAAAPPGPAPSAG